MSNQISKICRRDAEGNLPNNQNYFTAQWAAIGEELFIPGGP